MAKIDNPVFVTISRLLYYDLSQFFSDPPSCLIIFRILPEISKNLILRIINSSKNGKIELSQIKNHDIFINTDQNISIYYQGLMQIGIIKRNENFNSTHIQFNEVFISTLRNILSEGIKNNENISFHHKPKGYETSLERGINKFYKFINEKIFNQVNKTKSDNYINTFLTKINFLHLQGDRYQLGPKAINLFLLTNEDMIKNFFQFYIVFSFDKNNKTEKKIKFFKLIFYLTTLEPGVYFNDIPPNYYDKSFEENLDFMSQAGFIIIKQDKSNNTRKICCTPLIQCLFENINISRQYSLLRYGDENAERFLFVETNMKFYAYMPFIKKNIKNKDNSNLSFSYNTSESFISTSIKEEREEKTQDQKTLFNINLLKTIFNIEIILPNMLIGYITRDCLRKLFKDSKSEFILQFLSEHMSLKSDDVTEIKGKKYLINESVVNQILILEKEKNSITVKPVLCYFDFYNPKQYELYSKKMEEKQIECIYTNKEVIVIHNNEENRRKMNIIENEVSKEKY